MIYVDSLNHWGWKIRGRRVASCHMIADTADELHDFAATIGLKREWYHDGIRYPHYDLTASRRAAAVEAGAIECDRRAFVGHMRRTRGR